MHHQPSYWYYFQKREKIANFQGESKPYLKDKAWWLSIQFVRELWRV
jgi:hypothetical protein